MPPIPIQEDVFSDPEMTLSISSLHQRETYLSTRVIPELATLSPTTSLIEQQRLSASLREDLEDFGRRVEALEQLVEDLRKPSERETGRVVVERWATVYASLKKDARGAVLASKRTIDAHAKSRRDELLGSAVLSGGGGSGTKDNESTDDALMRTTANLTDALRRTEARLRAELDRSILSTQLLTSQTATLRQTSDAHGKLGGLLETSKGLITALERTDWLDRMLIMGGLAVFLLACAWIVKVRIFDRAVGIAFWWVRWLPSIDFGNAEDRMMRELEKGARVVESVVTSSVASATSALGAAKETLASTASSVVSKASEASEVLATFVDATLSHLDATDGIVNGTMDAISSASTVEPLATMIRDEL